jgi:hypothetical protein
MGRLLGIGMDLYSRYELGEVPSASNGRLLRTLIDHREALIRAIKNSTINDSNKEKAINALNELTLAER